LTVNNDWDEQEKYSHAKELANQHWSYVKRVILQHQPDIPVNILEMVEYHYVSALTHGWGHGWEDCENNRQG